MRRLWPLCLTAMMGVVLAASKEALAFLPNFELVSLCVILFTLVFRRWVAGALAVFLLLEGLLYGFGLWWLMYLYVWPLLALLFGLLFGSLCALVYLPMGGPKMALAWALAGLPFDAVHAGGNFLLALTLYRPLRRALDRLERTIHI